MSDYTNDVVKVSYNIDSETKSILEKIKAETKHKNFSQLINGLLKFDIDSLTTYIEIMNFINNPENKNSSIVTSNGGLILNKHTMDQYIFNASISTTPSASENDLSVSEPDINKSESMDEIKKLIYMVNKIHNVAEVKINNNIEILKERIKSQDEYNQLINERFDSQDERIELQDNYIKDIAKILEERIKTIEEAINIPPERL
ncbi:MAG: hypothetical protein A3E21_09530 [Sulfurimonas sp. RIFCSPHIGHO2_12_FULL_36_9]|uniref:hypothetical protein n=1 Tax=Sulfurimonas sp. RIFCSPLOWO2_12_36_12 TaxID=1802253 RepID=UPI0008D453A4|nr:hypothetical protein [Sulfurimonas sp. RIFCSPLOWO2_12_36_12]OHD96740.1 MAG: hypothetical protein A3E21_09530 [Sulfurimonas sp. RIFCSPHIGHO2_12_FULL_36_9]OHE00298.1 MAG: hypothetical protein A3J26_06760 [Sulfurimonas sp. RIFCSPLOWO2_02_FULL_36_28]OHE02091.1 MAG: hypothetical protein A2W82_05250 [Sulfurimonas sp. RIFCSPLOWO2_12_36_12]